MFTLEMNGRIAIIALCFTSFVASWERCNQTELEGNVVVGFYRGSFFHFVFGTNQTKQQNLDPDYLFGTNHDESPLGAVTPLHLLPLSRNRVALFFKYKDLVLVSFYELNHFDEKATLHDPYTFPMLVGTKDSPFTVLDARNPVRYENGKIVFPQWEFPVDEKTTNHSSIAYNTAEAGKYCHPIIDHDPISFEQCREEEGNLTSFVMIESGITCEFASTTSKDFSNVQLLPGYASRVNLTASEDHSTISNSTVASTSPALPSENTKAPATERLPLAPTAEVLHLSPVADGLPLAAILGVSFGLLGCILLFIALFVFLCCICKKAKKKDDYQFELDARNASYIENPSNIHNNNSSVIRRKTAAGDSEACSEESLVEQSTRTAVCAGNDVMKPFEPRTGMNLEARADASKSESNRQIAKKWPGDKRSNESIS